LGRGHSELLAGTDEADFIAGGRGNDWLLGGAGDDILRGGAGNDRIDGGDGIDLLDFSDGRCGIYFVLRQGENPCNSGGWWSTGYLGGGLGGDRYQNVEGVTGTRHADTLIGSGHDDYLYGGGGRDLLRGGGGDDFLSGGEGNDRLYGGEGDDVLVGGAGSDRLHGGSGSDTFAYLDASDSPRSDWILDFTQGEDLIDLDALLGATDLAWGGTAATANGVWFALAGCDTKVLADTDGNLANGAELKIVLKDFRLELTPGDFIGVSAGDFVAPTLAVDIVKDFLSNGEARSAVVFQFSEDVAGFGFGDIAVSGGALIAFTRIDGNTYTAIFTANDDAEAVGRVSVAAGSYADLAGNAGGAGEDTVGIDTHNPTLYELEFGDGALDNAKNWTLISIKFSEAVEGFDLGDLAVTGGYLSEFTPLGGGEFLVTFTAEDGTQATGTVSVAAGSYTDRAGNPGSGASDEVAIDTSAPAGPTLVIEDDEPGVASIAGGEVVFTFMFSEAVPGFDEDDIVVTNGSADTFTQLDDFTYTLAVIPDANFEGELRVAVGADEATQEVDTRAPTANVWITDIEVDSGDSADDFITNDTSPTILGRHGPLADGEKIQVSGDGGLTWDDATLLGGGDWSYEDQVARGDGVVVYQARVVDGAGNEGDTDSLAVTVDTIAIDDIVFAFADVPNPLIPASLPIATLGAVPAGSYNFTIQSQGGSGAETFAIVTLAGGVVQLRTVDGAPPLGEGASYSVTVSVTDFVGNTYSETVGIHTGSNTVSDTIVATVGRTDVVYGYGLDDTITGRDGPDALFGGGGNDTFDYNAVSDSRPGAASRDVITGFTPGEDKIDVSGIDADTSTTGDDAFVFVTMQTDEVQPNLLNWFQAGGNTYVQADVDGNYIVDFEIQLAGNVNLAEGDFVL
jgi:hypothetical protein